MIKKRIIPFILVLVLMLSVSSLVVFASSQNVVDEPGLLSSDEVNSIQAKCDEVKQATGVTPYVIFLNTINNPNPNEQSDWAIDYAKQYCIDNNLDGNSIIYLLAMDSRDYVVYANTDAQSTYTARVRENIVNKFYPDLHSGNYYQSAIGFLNGVETPVTFNWFSPKMVLIALVAGFLISLIISLSIKKQLTSVNFAANASEYETAGSLQIRNRSDQFLFFTVSKVAKPKNNSNGGMHSSGGGTAGKF